MKAKVDMIVDLQFGSTGKGLIAGYLAEKNEYEAVVTANMPNAGHTYINAEGRQWMHKVLPNGLVSPKCKYVMIGAGAVFDPDRLWDELQMSADFIDWINVPTLESKGRQVQLIIHPNAVVLCSRHKELETQTLSKISSTMQGSMAALVEKMQRNADNDSRAANYKDKWFGGAVVDVATWQGILMGVDSILAEGAQGYSLGLNNQFWPHCTSRDCTPARFLADMGIPVKMLRKVIGTARVHPIRVGNTPDGYSGDVYPDQKEISFADIGQDVELTTVTKRPRRIFTYSRLQMQRALFECAPDEVFLNFCNYDEEESFNVEFDINTIGASLNLDDVAQPIVRYLGWGPRQSDVKEIW